MPIRNHVLAAVSPADYARLVPQLTQATLTFGDILYEPGDRIRYVYFPDDALVSLLTVVDRHLALEVGMVGREGMVGLARALGVVTSPMRALVQGGGTAWRMSAMAFHKSLGQNASLQNAVNAYTHFLLMQVAQTAACNRFHDVPARLARWLLMTRDRLNADQFRLTHEFLGHMLGVRRVGVTTAASELRRQNLIEYQRGHIVILDRPGLEKAACSCYHALKWSAK
ncbi:MAG: Crp/Fnr family transcriptional regulator [Betaproteobacteria bacterium]